MKDAHSLFKEIVQLCHLKTLPNDELFLRGYTPSQLNNEIRAVTRELLKSNFSGVVEEETRKNIIKIISRTEQLSPSSILIIFYEIFRINIETTEMNNTEDDIYGVLYYTFNILKQIIGNTVTSREIESLQHEVQNRLNNLITSMNNNPDQRTELRYKWDALKNDINKGDETI